MRRLAPYVAVLMVYVMTPSAGEITENVIHLLASGHTAYANDDEHHERTGDEHGCSGTFHICPCHSTPLFALRVVRTDVGAVLHAGERLPWASNDANAEGFVPGVFRPPVA